MTETTQLTDIKLEHVDIAKARNNYGPSIVSGERPTDL